MENCKEIKKLIARFDKEKLSLKQEEMFVKHVCNCADCKEELEIYYIIQYSILEDSDNTDNTNEFFDNLDFTGFVEKRLKDSIEKCFFIRKWSWYNKLRYFLVTACMGFTALGLFIIKFVN